MTFLEELDKRTAKINELELELRYVRNDRARLIIAVTDLVCCPAFNGALFQKDKDSHKVWTLGRLALQECEKTMEQIKKIKGG